MDSKVRIHLQLNPAAQVLKEHGLDIDGKAQLFLSSEVKRLCDPYVPFRDGPLKDTAVVGQTYVDYITPYARRQYYEKNYKHKGIRAMQWDKRMMADKGKELVQSVAKYCGGSVK